MEWGNFLQATGTDGGIIRAMPRLMEHTTNYIVGLALQRLLPHHQVAAEHAPRRGDRGKKPDIDIRHGETRIVLEAKVDNKNWAARDAAARFSTLRPKPAIVGALSYTPAFSASNAAEAIRAGAEFKFAFANSKAPEAWEDSWRTGTVYDLAQAIRHPGDMGVGARDEVAEAVQRIREKLNDVVAYYNTTGSAARNDIVRALGAAEDDKGSVRRAGLIVTNALMFYAALRDSQVRDKNGKPFHPRSISGKPPAEICGAWKNVRECVNYDAILELAERLTRDGGITTKMLESLQGGAEIALPMARSGVDILGRIFHEVLENAKPMAAYYTSIPGSALMSELALAPDNWEGVDWAKPESVGRLRVCDPSCGSGTLSAALAWKIRDNYLRAALSQKGWEKENGDGLRELQKQLVENVMRGYDISRAAVHMTATALGLISPEVNFQNSRVFTLRIGPTSWGKIRLGSLDYLDPDFNPVKDAGKHATDEEKSADRLEPLSVDLCAMNPPFVSGRTGQESFGFIKPEKARRATVDAFVKMGEKHNFRTGRGQGPAFVALAVKTVKPGGRLAMILPTALAMGGGVEWTETREMLEGGFNLEAIITSKDPDRPAFSDSADLSECMALARKLRDGEKPSAKPALFVSLHQSPETREKALAVSREIRTAMSGKKCYGDIGIDNAVVGKFARVSYRGRGAWFGVNFADPRLIMAADEFAATGSLQPYADGNVPVRLLEDSADVGSHRTRNYILEGKLELSNARRYAVYYPSCQQERGGPAPRNNGNLLESPLCWVMPTAGNEKWIANYYKAAGRLVFSASFRFNSSRRIAAMIDTPVQGVDHWPLTLKGETENRLKAMTLWMATSPSILMTMRAVVATAGAWVKMGKGCLKKLTVLNLDAIGEDRVDALAACFDEFVASGARLGQLRDIAGDPVRAELDGKVAKILGLGDLHGNLQPLRDALGNEPVITNRPVGAV